MFLLIEIGYDLESMRRKSLKLTQYCCKHFKKANLFINAALKT